MVDFPIVVKLADPVTVGDKTVSELIFSRYFQVKDLIAMDAVQGPTRQDAAIRASAAGVQFQVFSEMRASDLRRVREATAPLMGEWLGLTAESDPPSPNLSTGG